MAKVVVEDEDDAKIVLTMDIFLKLAIKDLIQIFQVDLHHQIKLVPPLSIHHVSHLNLEHSPSLFHLIQFQKHIELPDGI